MNPMPLTLAAATSHSPLLICNCKSFSIQTFTNKLLHNNCMLLGQHKYC
jgi:hypothetical protein